MLTRGLAIDVRHIDTGALLGVGLVFPLERHLSILAEGAGRAVEPELTASAWREIDGWATAGDSGLPARTAPMSPTISAALLEGARLSVSAQRFASVPISVTSRAELGPLSQRLLPELLNARRSVAQ